MSAWRVAQAERERRVLWSFVASVAKRIKTGGHESDDSAPAPGAVTSAEVGIEMRQFAGGVEETADADDGEGADAEDGEAALARISAMSPCAMQVSSTIRFSIFSLCMVRVHV